MMMIQPKNLTRNDDDTTKDPYQAELYKRQQNVIMENGILKLTMSQPDGALTGIQYGGMKNLLDTKLTQSQRGYWDINWNLPGGGDRYLLFILRSGISGFYCYAIYERLAGWPAFDLIQTRLVFKLRRELFHYMAITDEKQRIMPMPEDFSPRRCKVLALSESVLLTNPINPTLKGEVVGQCMWGRGDGAEKGVLWLQKGLRGLETGLEGVRQIWAAVMTVTAWDEW
ncbi:hypothetical protein MRB53_005855 [Persea americana]|uniref:Uncharacterized protein n=1 Tax=Persea americana TaxID=3435 RepID=A0ACC2MEI1_PERAE|nr:hypothetical protein MRB53_005855 [Persea americana]